MAEKTYRKLTLDDFDIGKPLGKGKFGSVFLVREKKHKYICALKVSTDCSPIERSGLRNRNLLCIFINRTVRSLVLCKDFTSPICSV